MFVIFISLPHTSHDLEHSIRANFSGLIRSSFIEPLANLVDFLPRYTTAHRTIVLKTNIRNRTFPTDTTMTSVVNMLNL